MNTNDKFMLDDRVKKIDEKQYNNLIGWLIYFIYSRPNIMFIVSLFSIFRYMNNSSKYHFERTERVFRYIKETLNYIIRYSQIKYFQLYSYINIDSIDCIDDERSILEFVLSHGSRVILWIIKN